MATDGNDTDMTEDIGFALQIVSGSQTGTGFELNAEALNRILLSPEVINRPVVVISVAGAFRKGKSFLLDFMLRYLIKDTDSWLDDKEEILSGFSWKSGSKPDTNGILLWSKPFIRTLPDTGEEVAVLLMDTQGAFDTKTTVKQCATIFALSTMLSSFQIYNLTQQIQENDLQHLQLFTEYARLASEYKLNERPFQSLMFLVRDWYHEDDHSYGNEGGVTYMQETLNTHYGQAEELSLTREHIMFCFNQIQCFLMPHPGLNVAKGSGDFCGQVKDIDQTFITHLKSLIPLVLATDKLKIKKISGNIITGKKLVHYMNGYVKIFLGGELPEPKSMLEATAEANHLSAKDDSIDVYKRIMDDVCGPGTPYLNPTHLEETHSNAREDSFKTFRTIKKMGGTAMNEKFEELLSQEIDKLYVDYSKINENKNVFMAARTPAVLTSIIFICYLISGVVGLFSNFLAAVLMLIMVVSILLLTVWAVSRYTGQYREIASMIDNLTELIWQHAIATYFEKALSKGGALLMKNVTKIKID